MEVTRVLVALLALIAALAIVNVLARIVLYWIFFK